MRRGSRTRGSGTSTSWDRPGPSLLGADMSEKELDRRIQKLCKELGIRLSYHTYRSTKSEKGFPDRVYVGKYGVLFRELKTDIGVRSPEQIEWLDGLVAAGADAAVWRPADLFSGRIARELAAIATRSPFL
jgi:hypothetical protein